MVGFSERLPDADTKIECSIMGNHPTIVWFRRDLRVADNPALLYGASQDAPIVPVYVADWEQGDRWAPGKAGSWWLAESLGRLSASLGSRGAALRVVPGRAEEVIPRLARSVEAREVVWNRLYEPYSRNVDRQVEVALERQGVSSRSFNAALLFEPEEHYSGSGRPFVQFTAFWRSCLALSEPGCPGPGAAALRALEGQGASLHAARDAATAAENEAAARAATETLYRPAREWEPLEGPAHWEPGEAGAKARLERFLDDALTGYASERDVPGVDGTSRLSPHLHFGEIGPRQIWHAVREAARTVATRPATASGPESFLRQLGWREFAHYLLYHFPDMPTESFRPEFARFSWEDDADGLDAWKRGATGYPLVDAGMHQMLVEGWMHNRIRMVAASFLTKDLLIPWQQGAAWFWDRLVDADLANNSLGWQWTAGSGPDAAPYFRIFNPLLQARRFDPDGAYSRRWTGDMFASAAEGIAPAHIVDHGEARARALAAFREARRR
jgi:deoxyribodipyrimidine photo-lyase